MTLRAEATRGRVDFNNTPEIVSWLSEGLGDATEVLEELASEENFCFACFSTMSTYDLREAVSILPGN